MGTMLLFPAYENSETIAGWVGIGCWLRVGRGGGAEPDFPRFVSLGDGERREVRLRVVRPHLVGADQGRDGAVHFGRRHEVRAAGCFARRTAGRVQFEPRRVRELRV